MFAAQVTKTVLHIYAFFKNDFPSTVLSQFVCKYKKLSTSKTSEQSVERHILESLLVLVVSSAGLFVQ